MVVVVVVMVVVLGCCEQFVQFDDGPLTSAEQELEELPLF